METEEMIVIHKQESKITLSTAGRTVTFYCEPEELRDCSRLVSDLFLEGSFIHADLSSVCDLAAAKQKVRLTKGFATGENRAEKAARKAFEHIGEAFSVLMLLKMPPNAALAEAEAATTTAVAFIHPEASVLWGVDLCEEIGEGFAVEALVF